MPLKYDAHLNEDRALHADMLESLRRNNAEIISDSQNGLLLRDKSWELYMLSAVDGDEGKRLLDMMETRNTGAPDRGDVVVRGAGITGYARALGFEHTQPLMQVLYEKSEPPGEKITLELRHPDEKDFRAVAETYHILGEEQLRENFLSEDFFAGYDNGRFAGYIGVHQEGSIGMLYVFEDCRRRGYAKQLYSFMIERQLGLGRLAYGQVLTDNEASLALQRDFGLTFSREPVFWMWR